MNGSDYRLRHSDSRESALPRRGRWDRLTGPGILGNALALYGVQGVNIVVPLLMLPYLLRVLSPEGYGAIMLAQSLMGYGIILTEFGFNLTSARDISVARDDPAAVARIFWTTTAAKVVLLCASLVIAGVTVTFVPAFYRHADVFAASSLLLFGNVAFPQWYFQGLEKLRQVALVQAIAKCLVALLAFLLVRAQKDLWIAALILSVPQFAGALAARCLSIPLAPALFYRPTATDIKEALARNWHIFASVVSTTLYLHMNTLVLGVMCGEQQVALYSLGTRLMAALQAATSPVIQAVYPRASLLFVQDPQSAWQLLKRVATWVLPAMLAACLMLAIFAPTIVRLIGGSSYSGAVTIVRITAAVPLLVTVAAGLSQVVMVNTGLTRQLSRIYLAVGCANLVLLPILTEAFKAEGAGVALTTAELLGPLLMSYVIWRHPRGQQGARDR